MIGVLTSGAPPTPLLRGIQAGAGGVGVVAYNSPVLAAAQSTRGVFCELGMLPRLLGLLQGPTPRIYILSDDPDFHAIEELIASPQIIGVLPVTSARRWEYILAARQMLTPTSNGPRFSKLLPWGSAQMSWRPNDTESMKTVVDRVETISRRFGVSRRTAAAVSQAAHELLMNAMYDAPVDEHGNPKYAMNRTRTVTLDPADVPILELTISGDFVALDTLDRFGRLSRDRFYNGILRGLASATSTIQLDTSHGGAGLGIHRLFHDSTILRAEVFPKKKTLVSWMIARRDRSSGPAPGRSLYFQSQVATDVLDLGLADIVAPAPV